MSKEYTQVPWYATHLSILAGPTELASLLGLSRPSVVTNWRGRYPDFPAPKVGGSSPQYDVVDVMAWLRLSGSRAREVPLIAADRWWEAVVGAFHAQSEVPSPRATMVSLVLLHCVLHRELLPDGPEHWSTVTGHSASVRSDLTDDPKRLADAVARAARWAERRLPTLDSLLVAPLRVPPPAAGALADLVRALRWYVDQLETPAPWRGLLDTVLATGVDGRPTPQRVTRRPLAALMAALGEVPEGGVVLDPAAGEAGMLLAAARRCGRRGRLHGQELDTDTWRIARAVLVVHEVEVDLDGPGHNSITDDRFPDVRADVVLIDPPVGPGAPQLDLWVEHGLRHLARGGRVVVALPMSELVEVRASRRSANTRLVGYVQTLAADHRIDAVLAVPRGTRRDVVGPIALVAIGDDRADSPMIDVGVVSQLPGSTEGASDRELDVEADGVVARLRGRSGSAHRPGYEFVRPSRVGPAELFDFLGMAAVQLEAKGPRAVRWGDIADWSPGDQRALRMALPEVVSEAVSTAPDFRRGKEIVELALRLIDRLERDRHSLDTEQARAVLDAMRKAERLVEPLSEP